MLLPPSRAGHRLRRLGVLAWAVVVSQVLLLVINLLTASITAGLIVVHAAMPAVLDTYPERRDPTVAGYIAVNDCAQLGQHYVLVRDGHPDALVAVADCAWAHHVAYRNQHGYIADVDAKLWAGAWVPQPAELWTVDAREWHIEQEWMN